MLSFLSRSSIDFLFGRRRPIQSFPTHHDFSGLIPSTIFIHHPTAGLLSFLDRLKFLFGTKSEARYFPYMLENETQC